LIDSDYSVVVVDDGSNDSTWSILLDLPVYALRHPINLGQGAALQTGMTFALRQGAQVIVHFDADGQHRAEDIDLLIEPVLNGESDVVFGSRFLRRADSSAVPLLKRCLLRCATVFNGVMCGVWQTDAHNGFRALSPEAAKRICIHENGYAHASELVSQIQRLGLRYIERPTTIIYSEYSKAKGQSAWNALNIAIDLLLGRIFR
jgi:glycosyltransferase involved in cell wall biosynthesis